MKTMNWKCIDCKTKWPHPLDGTAPQSCPGCGGKNFFDINLEPVSAGELAAMGLPVEWASPPPKPVSLQYLLRHNS